VASIEQGDAAPRPGSGALAMTDVEAMRPSALIARAERYGREHLLVAPREMPSLK